MASAILTRRLVPVIAALSTPALSVFVVLVAAGDIKLWPAFLGALATVLLTGLLLRPYGSDMADVAAYVRVLERGGETGAPALRTGLAADVLAAIGQLRRRWKGQSEQLTTLVDFHETLFESLPSPLFLLNRQRRVVRANLAARKIFGRQLTGRDLATVLRNPTVLDAAERVLKGEPGQDVEFSLPGPNERDFRVMLEPLPEAGVDDTVAVLSANGWPCTARSRSCTAAAMSR